MEESRMKYSIIPEMIGMIIAIIVVLILFIFRFIVEPKLPTESHIHGVKVEGIRKYVTDDEYYRLKEANKIQYEW